jgi:hypothetical protein
MYSGVGAVSRRPSNWGRSAAVVSCRVETKPFAPSFNQSAGSVRSSATVRASSQQLGEPLKRAEDGVPIQHDASILSR